MFYITSRSIKSQGSEMFYYDRSTVQIGKWLTFCCALLFATFVCSGFRGEWVGQQGKDLTVNDIRLTSFDNGVPCMRMQIIATPAHFNGRVPNQVDLLAQIPEEVAAIWSFTTASWVRADGSSAYIVSKGPIREIVEEASLVEDKDQPAGPVDVVYRGLPSEDGIYKLYIDLKPTDQRTKVITSEYLAASSDEQRDDVARNAKDAFKKQFDDAKAKLLAPGGAKVFLKPKAGIELW